MQFKLISRKNTGTMAWASITENLRTNLVFLERNLNSERYINEVLRHKGMPFMRQGPEI